MFYSRRYDHRTRSDRIQIQINHWREQIDILTSAYLHWQVNGQPKHESDATSWAFTVISFEGMVLAYCSKNKPSPS
jgi:hypothetical protein